jgi:phosphoserine phosphatase RsbU/P
MNQTSAGRLPAETLAAAMDLLPEGVLVVDGEWVVGYVNPAGARLLQRRPEELLGQDLWVAVPEIGGTILHSFLLHARSVSGPVMWSGFYPPAGTWLKATAVALGGDLLQVSLRAADAGGQEPAPSEGPADSDQGRLRFLAEVSEAMIAALPSGESATRLAELVVDRLCDWAVVALAGENGGGGQEAWAHHDAARRADLDTYMTGRLRGTGDDTAMVNALLTGQPVQVPELHQELVAPSLATEEVRAAWARLDATSCTIVPLRARGETFGALAMMNVGDRPLHSEAEIAVAVEVARRGALALDNARLYGRQLTVAEKLQRSLLTEPPQPDELEVVVRYRPATTHMHIGGDWYDAFAQPDGALLAVIGDVVGHDVDAAAAMGQIRSILRGIAYDRPDTPARVLARVDTVLTGLDVGSMATALVARVEQSPAQRREGVRTFRWSSAGHLPPLVLHPDGAVDVLASPPERLLGTEDAGPRRNHEVQLPPGVTVLLYTDGLVEHGRTTVDDGIAKLTGVLGELTDLPLDEMCDRLLERMVPDRGDDDVALLALRCHPQKPV